MSHAWPENEKDSPVKNKAVLALLNAVL